MLNVGHIVISDLIVANLFMLFLPGIILLYLATPFYTEDVLHEISFYNHQMA